MRILGALLLVLLLPLGAAAQSDNAPAPGATARPTLQLKQFRKPGLRTTTLRARAAARRSHGATQSPEATAADERSQRTSPSSAQRKRAPSLAHGRAPPAPIADKLAVQLDLAWTGDYAGLISAEANDKTAAAIKAFQRDRKFKETGVLNTQERALLAASAKAKQAQVGWTMLDDAATGARLGIPARQAPNKAQGKAGTRWSSAQGQVQVETFRIREPGLTLASVYEQQKREPSTRNIELNVLRNDFFILSGMQGLKKFYVRAEYKDGEVRGLTVLYDQATENIMDPVAVVMANAFTAFPGAIGMAQIEPAPKRKVEYGSGIIVSEAGHILTARQLTEGCGVIVVSGYGDAVREAVHSAPDLALLRVYGVPDLTSADFAAEDIRGPDVTLIGIADPQLQAGGSATSTMAARLKGENLDPAPPPGFSGAAVLDARSRPVGMIELRTPMLAAIGSANAQPRATIIPASAIRAFLGAQQLPAAQLAPGGARIERASNSVVRVICVRR
jgi:hypothetical protein